MGELLELIRTFVHMRESDTTIEEGQRNEFLRGTFSIMELNEGSKEKLDQVKAKFMRVKKEMNGLDSAEFEEALMPMLDKGISRNHVQTTFRKMDPCDEGQVTWNDFMNFAIEEHSKRLQMKSTMDEMPFAHDVVAIKHHHKDPITKITFMPTVDVNTKHIDWGIGKYLVLSRDGILSIWSSRMKNKGYANLTSRDRRDGSWYTDMVAMYHNNFIAVATTSRDLSFYDYTQQGWTRKYWLRRLPQCVTAMSYWAGLEHDQKAVLVWGDTSGSVTMLEFDLSQMAPMFGIRIREVCNDMGYPELARGDYSSVVIRVYRGIHKNWVKEVKYIPQANSFVSCCMDDNTALYMSPVDITKKSPAFFTCCKGVLCFDYSHELNILVAAGIDCNIWMYNPYIPHKVVAVMEGHVRPVAHVKINELDNYCVSIDLSKTVIISNLSSQEVIMRIPGQTVRLGTSSINTVYLNSVRRMCLLGAYDMCMLIRQRVEGLHVDVRSHDHKMVGALYSTPFEQVVSVCRGSMVRIWDIITGTRVMQFAMAHSKKVQGRIVPVEIECIALTENKKRLFTAAEGVIKIWNFSVGVVLRVLDMSNSPKITSIVMAKSLIYVTGWNKYINVFSDFKGEEALKKAWQRRHNEDCLSLCILEPNLIASSSYDGSITVWSRETTEAYCLLSASFNHKPELNTAVRGGGAKNNIMSVVADLDGESDDGDDEQQGEDAFMTIGKHLRKESGWYRLLRALKKRQIEREKRRAMLERKDFSSKYKKKKRRMNMQGLSLVYESAVECMVYLESRRPIDPQTATLVAGGAECWIRFWSLHPKGGLLGQFTSTRRKLESIRCMATDKQNQYLLTGDTMGLLRIWDIKEFCNVDKLSTEEREARDKRIRREFVYTRSPFKPEEILDTMEKLREKRISVPDASKPRKNLKSPRLLSSIRAHTHAIVSVELIEERNLILTSGMDLTVRLWTKNCTYVGTFGEVWRPLAKMVANVVEKKPRIPKDIVRCASARTLFTLHNGKCPHWKNACFMIRRHIYQHRKDKLMDETRAKKKAEMQQAHSASDLMEEESEGEEPFSKVLGKFYQPRKRYMGPISLNEQGLPGLRVFRGKAAPYHSTPPQGILPMVPVHTVPTLLDIDSRRTGVGKHRRITKQMMREFSAITGENRTGQTGFSSTSGSEFHGFDLASGKASLIEQPSMRIDQINASEQIKSARDSTQNRSPDLDTRTEDLPRVSVLDALKGIEANFHKKITLNKSRSNDTGGCPTKTSSTCTNSLFSERSFLDYPETVPSESLTYLNRLGAGTSRKGPLSHPSSANQTPKDVSLLLENRSYCGGGELCGYRYEDFCNLPQFLGSTASANGSASCSFLDDGHVSEDDFPGFSTTSDRRKEKGKVGGLFPELGKGGQVGRGGNVKYSHLL